MQGAWSSERGAGAEGNAKAVLQRKAVQSGSIFDFVRGATDFVVAPTCHAAGRTWSSVSVEHGAWSSEFRSQIRRPYAPTRHHRPTATAAFRRSLPTSSHQPARERAAIALG